MWHLAAMIVFVAAATAPFSGKLKLSIDKINKITVYLFSVPDFLATNRNPMVSRNKLHAVMNTEMTVLRTMSTVPRELADIVTQRSLSPLQFGCAGDGTTDDTTCFQAAVNAAGNAGVPLRLDGAHKYLTTSTIASSKAVKIRGSTPGSGIYATSCPSGLVVSSNITALSLTGSGASVRDLCIQMAAAAGTRTSGAAIAVGSDSTTNVANEVIEDNTIINPYDGILVGGATASGVASTQNAQIIHNVIINPSHYGIANGASSNGGSTNGTVVYRDQIQCNSGGASAIGFAFFDGAFVFDGGDGGAYNCNVGTEIDPGANQMVSGTLTNVIGDSSRTNDFLINTSASSAVVRGIRASKCWASSVSATDGPLKIANDGNGIVNGVVVDGCVLNNNSSAIPIVDLWASSSTNTPQNVTLSDNLLTGFNGTPGIGIRVNSPSPYNLVIEGNQFQPMATGVSLPTSPTSGGDWTIIGNNFAGVTTPVAYTPGSIQNLDLAHNLGIDNACDSIASAASITVPASYNCARISGSTTITDITASAWSNRQITLISLAGVSLDSGGATGTKFCTAKMLAALQSTMVEYDGSDGCWVVF